MAEIRDPENTLVINLKDGEVVIEMLADVAAGKITEAFGCGTAAVIAPIGKFGYQDKEYVINNYEVGPVSKRLYQELTDIQYGRIPDRFGWTYTIHATNGNGHN